MSDLVPFQFDAHDVRLHMDAQGDIWWDGEAIRAVLTPHQGIHTKNPQEYFSLFEMLSIAADIHCHDLAMRLLTWISKCAVTLNKDTPSFWKLYGCVAMHLTWVDRLRDAPPDEFHWHSVFLANLEHLIPGARLLPNLRKEGAGVPDFFIKVENDVCPVEVKRNKFNVAAVKQLRGYIQAFQSPYGFAVAQDCTARLEQNMIFVSLKGLE